jgi:hypothetical protein
MELLSEIVLNVNGTKEKNKNAYRKKLQAGFESSVRGNGKTKDDILPRTKKRKHDNPQRLSTTELCDAERPDQQSRLFGLDESSKFRLVSGSV